MVPFFLDSQAFNDRRSRVFPKIDNFIGETVSDVSSFSIDSAAGSQLRSFKGIRRRNPFAKNIRARGGGYQDTIADRPRSLSANSNDDANFQSRCKGATGRLSAKRLSFQPTISSSKMLIVCNGKRLPCRSQTAIVKTSSVPFGKTFYIEKLEDGELSIMVFKEICAPIYSNFTFTRRSLTGYHDAMFSAR